jgi:hypothetical protein
LKIRSPVLKAQEYISKHIDALGAMCIEIKEFYPNCEYSLILEMIFREIQDKCITASTPHPLPQTIESNSFLGKILTNNVISPIFNNSKIVINLLGFDSKTIVSLHNLLNNPRAVGSLLAIGLVFATVLLAHRMG